MVIQHALYTICESSSSSSPQNERIYKYVEPLKNVSSGSRKTRIERERNYEDEEMRINRVNEWDMFPNGNSPIDNYEENESTYITNSIENDSDWPNSQYDDSD